MRGLIEAYSRPRLLTILVEAAAADPALRALLGTAADASPSHRRLFTKPTSDGSSQNQPDCHMTYM